eukprot:scpid81604/ scgid18325/ PiggyBac transposable element-derived protein 4
MESGQEEAVGTTSDVEFAEELVVEGGDEAEDSESDDDLPQPTPQAAAGRPPRQINVGWTQELPQNDLPDFEGHPGLKAALSVETLQSPLDLLCLYLPSDLMQRIRAQTNLYYYQWVAAHPNDVESARPWSNLTVAELKVWMGVLFNNALHPYPSMTLYWSSEELFGNDKIKSRMSLTRYQQIKRFLHVADSSLEPKHGTPQFDPLYKVRPMLNVFLEKCKELYSPTKQLSLDEMDIAFKGRSAYKSRIKFKRAGDGFLVYALCDPHYFSGYTWSFYFQFDPFIPMEPNLSKTFNAVVQLMKQLPSKGHHVFVDNLSSNTRLAEILLERGQLYTCTARADRVPTCVKQPVKKGQAAKDAQGTTKWAARNNVVVLTYYDSKPVAMLTTAHHTLEDVTFTRPRVRFNPQS